MPRNSIHNHPPTGDKVRIWIGIPISNWNGRFMGTGGGGFMAVAQWESISRLLKATLPARRIQDMRAEAAVLHWVRMAAELATHPEQRSCGHT